jgi:hypothetical protein
MIIGSIEILAFNILQQNILSFQSRPLVIVSRNQCSTSSALHALSLDSSALSPKDQPQEDQKVHIIVPP